ncbi:hypothetical protein R3X28_13070 [Maribacter sp. TH_r10]|uniref:hypothetical protein n=1 Tax=Maribacter sp. TH_r10 TaxID=3082086 RepID=UPI002954569F|nr:hypothetical protein [Maribacter sp. TH_r10]MDV7139818.1 hypothetical protein [Maribacter sp. TH_r10]
MVSWLPKAKKNIVAKANRPDTFITRRFGLFLMNNAGRRIHNVNKPRHKANKADMA